MNTAETLTNLLRGRGGQFDATSIVSELYTQLADMEVTGQLLRQDRKRTTYGNDPQKISCNKATLDGLGEPAFTRAIFNQKYLYTGTDLLIHLDYEVSLSKIAEQKVDILSYNLSANRLMALEYKIKPKSNNTGVEFGLLEAFLYGLLLAKYLSKNDMQHTTKMVKNCISRRVGTATENAVVNDPQKRETIGAEFILAGPVSYFYEFVKDGRLADKRFARIQHIETAIRKLIADKGLALNFSGYMPFSEVAPKKCAIISIASGTNNAPFLNYLFSSITDVKKNIRMIAK